jgi:hypothetical protein
MAYLIDINVWSELQKGQKTDPGVQCWCQGVAPAELYLSVSVVDEVRRGIELLLGLGQASLQLAELAVRLLGEGGGTALQEFLLPAVVHGRVQLMGVTQIRDRHPVEQMLADDRNLLLGRVPLALLSHSLLPRLVYHSNQTGKSPIPSEASQTDRPPSPSGVPR